MNDMNSIACIEVMDFAMILRRVLRMILKSCMINKESHSLLSGRFFRKSEIDLFNIFFAGYLSQLL